MTKFFFFTSPDAINTIYLMCRLSIPYFLEPDLVHYLLNVGLLPPPPNYVHEPWSFPFSWSIFFVVIFCLILKKTFAVELVTNCINLKCKFFSIFSRVVKYILNTVIKSSFEINGKWNQLRNFINKWLHCRLINLRTRFDETGYLSPKTSAEEM